MSEIEPRQPRKYEFSGGEEGVFQMDPDLDEEEREQYEQLMQLPAKELKLLLRNSGISYQGFTEKVDFVRAYFEYERKHR